MYLCVQSLYIIVVAGHATQSNSGQDFAVARYKPDGTLDTAFGKGGIVITPVGSSTVDSAQSVVVQPDGKVVAAGYSGTSSQYQLALARYDADGSLDTAFNASGSKPGTVTTTVGSAPDSRIYAAALEPDGKIVVGGASGSSSAYKVMVAR
ncbi:MAG TPA: hypothetical protein VKA76_11810 [Gammaproteobacteria bacterium]|nr:hypothetical protein [Gammaproteobacteria bacterium]